MRNMHLALLWITASLLPAADWRPVAAEQLSLKTPKVDPNADAETIFWEAWVKDVSAGNGYLNHVVENYIRIKLYNDRAVEKYGNVEIPFNSEQKMSITQIRARTIQPDGSIVDLPGSAVKETLLAKSGRRNAKAKAFAMPALKPGSIIEYQWTEVFSEYVPRYVPLQVQREIPVWDVVYNVLPFTGFGFNERMGSYPFNCAPSPWEPVNDDVSHRGFVRTRLNKVPAYVEEPVSPAEDDTKAWILLFYSETTKNKPADYWKATGKQLLADFRKTAKVNNDVKQMALQVAGSGSTPQEKADLLAAWCQTQIKNVNYSAEGMTNEMRSDFFKNLKDEYGTGDTLKNKIGTSRHILALFYAMAEAAGLEPLYVRASSANSAIFRADFMDPFLLSNRVVAIKAGADYRYYNPAVPYLKPGMLDWDEQSQPALLADPKEPKLVVLPVTTPELSAIKRMAKLKISDEGKIEGTASLEFSGHTEVTEKLHLDDLSAAAREEDWRKRLEGRYPGAKISDLKIENANSPAGRLKISYRIEMESYGQRTGKRLFFQPAFFQFGERPLFSASTRKYPISFRNAYSEVDEVDVQLPEGYGLESADLPGNLPLAGVGGLSITGGVTNEALPHLRIKRNFTWGEKGNIYFDAKNYETMRKVWDYVHKANTHTLTLRGK